MSSLLGNYNRANLAFVKGEGCWLETEKGDKYLDFTSGIGVTSLGHAHPALVRRLQEQAGDLWHVSNLFQIPGQEKCADLLVEHSFADKVFFSNSGLEAVECAIKAARRFHYDQGEADRYEIITFDGAFHGRSMATLAAGGQEKYMEGFGPKLEGFVQVTDKSMDAVKAVFDPAKTAAILIEPIQGEGGIRGLPDGFLKDLRKLCDETGTLLMLDEIQCGMGRTGSLFAYMQEGIEPDVLCSAKGLGNGFPVGACLMTEAVASGMVPGTHGTTFGGNPLAMSVAGAVVEEMIRDGFLDDVKVKASKLAQRLEGLVASHPTVFEAVRGRGLMLGLKLKDGKSNLDLVAALHKEHMLTVGAGDNVVRLLPPLVLTEEDMMTALDALDRAAAQLAA